MYIIVKYQKNGGLKMKKIINNPNNVVSEALLGLAKACPELK
jgi:hypothetical protein